MIYLESYNSFNNINEKISWKGILWALFFGASVNYGYNKLFGKKGVVDLYKDIKKQDTQPDQKTSDLFNRLRQDIISKIKSSNRIEPDIKQKVIDSLQTIPFYIVDSEKYKGIDNTMAAFVHMPLNKATKLILGEHFQKSFITINKNYMKNTDQLSNTIVHEIYHYVDDLLGKDGEYWSELNNISDLSDSHCITDKEYMRRKLKFLLFGNKPESEISKSSIDLLDEQVDFFWENRNYYTSNSEIFARFQNMKRWLLKEGQIKSMNDKIEEKHMDYILNKDFYDLLYKKNLDFPVLLLFLNFDYESYNKIISKNGKFTNNLG